MTIRTQMVHVVDFDITNEGVFDIGPIFDNNRIDDYAIHIDTPFNGTLPELNIHTNEDPVAEIVSSNNIDLTVAGGTKTTIFFDVESDVMAQGTLSIDGSTQGAGTIYLYYV